MSYNELTTSELHKYEVMNELQSSHDKSDTYIGHNE